MGSSAQEEGSSSRQYSGSRLRIQVWEALGNRLPAGAQGDDGRGCAGPRPNPRPRGSSRSGCFDSTRTDLPQGACLQEFTNRLPVLRFKQFIQKQVLCGMRRETKTITSAAIL